MIGGNIIGTIQTKATTKNAIGEMTPTWTDLIALFGYLDMITDTSGYLSYNTKLSESTHVFVCDYKDLSSVDVRNSHMKIGSEIFDILSIDNPMNLNRQIEIILKKVG